MTSDPLSESNPQPSRWSFGLALLLFSLLGMSIVLFGIVRGVAILNHFNSVATLDATCEGNHCSFAIKREHGEVHAITWITGPRGGESELRKSLGPYQKDARAEITLDCPRHVAKFIYGNKTAEVPLNIRR